MAGSTTKRLTMHDRPFDGRLKEVCIRKEGSDLRLIAIPNPDYIPVNLREEGSRLIRPSPKSGYRSMSNIEYKKILIEYKVTENPPDTFGIASNISNTNKSNSNVNTNSIGGAGYTPAMASPPRTTPPTTVTTVGASTICGRYDKKCPDRIEIYGYENYKIPTSSFTYALLEQAARKDLGIDDPTKLVPTAERPKNFNKFVLLYVVTGVADPKEVVKYNAEIAIAKKEGWYDPGYFTEPTRKYSKSVSTSDSLYLKLQTYSNTDYGSLMIKEFVDNQKKYSGFTCNFNAPGTAAGNSKDKKEIGYINLPTGFPTKPYFPGGEKIHWLAVIHHEFGHTYGGGNLTGSVSDERIAAKDYDNPVRIIEGIEPRYTYWEDDSDTTINILDSSVTGRGKMTFDPNDPRKLIKRTKAQAKLWD